jgi:hypothetical protein
MGQTLPDNLFRTLGLDAPNRRCFVGGECHPKDQPPPQK